MKSRLPALVNAISPPSAVLMNFVRKEIAQPIPEGSAVDITPTGGAEYADTGVPVTSPSFEAPMLPVFTRLSGSRRSV
ncbi:hypothetical protein SAMN05216404_10868 [Nitrosospira multiformis]|uniref:Uncharacterized protein n=1 Tax=Nitrosospira multiformis TaxID=1231 RepID=A0A1H8K8Y7_9PROT|nr:hypothetical protein SAMN05216404_10868 [Nitrosospira multiformis]